MVGALPGGFEISVALAVFPVGPVLCRITLFFHDFQYKSVISTPSVCNGRHNPEMVYWFCNNKC